MENLTIEVQRVARALKKCSGDFGRAEKMLEGRWGADKAQKLVERYHHFIKGNSNHPDSKQNLLAFLGGLKEFLQNK